MASFRWVTFPLLMAGGIIVLLCLLATAAIGAQIMKGKTNLPMAWHMNLARLTILLAVIHGLLGMGMMLGW